VSLIFFCCGGFLLIVALIYLPFFMVRKGFDLVFGCLTNGFVIAIAAILLVIYIIVANVEVCQIWLVGEPICSLWERIIT